MPNVTDESAPTTKHIRVGIELEGFGRVNTQWEKEGEIAVIQEPSFYDVFKRTPLLRSASFSELNGLGVYLTPEDADEGYGTSSPVELVSNPHPFTLVSLPKLQSSVKKAKSPSSPLRKKQKAVLQDRRAPDVDPVSGKEATSKWAYSYAVISRNLQTTIGVSVEKLFSATKKVRELVVQTLILEKKRQDAVLSLIVATNAMQKQLTDPGGPLEALQSDKEILGLKLAVFMYLARISAAHCRDGKPWDKDAFGANFKGYSSFIGCGAANNNDILITAYGLDALKKKSMEEALILAVKPVAPDWLNEILSATLDIDNLGKPGLSTQTAVQLWFAIPNFYHNNHLYTVVESREGESLLNQEMAQFLNEKTSVATFHQSIKARLHQ